MKSMPTGNKEVRTRDLTELQQLSDNIEVNGRKER